MKKNFFKGFALVLGLVASLQVGAFAGCSDGSCGKSCDMDNKPKTHFAEQKICKFTGRYELSTSDLDEFQNLIDNNLQKGSSNLDVFGFNKFDLKIGKVKLNIKPDGTGKFSVLVNFNIGSNEGFDVYSKTWMSFDISQKGDDTFVFNMSDCEGCNPDKMKLSKKLINGKKCLVVMTDDDNFNRIVFEKVK